MARVFERIFEIYRDQFTLLIPAALLVFVPVAVISGVIYAGDVGILGALIVAAIGTIATYWFQGMVVEAARDILDGRRDHSVGSLLQAVVPVLGPLIVAGILAGIAIGFGLLLLIVPGLFLLTIWAVLAPVIVIERRDALSSFGRSRELVRGHGWQVFSVIVVLFLLQFLVTAVIQSLANSVADSVVGFSVADLIVRLLVAPLSALAAAVLFFELRALRGEPVLADGTEVARAGRGATGAATPGRAAAPGRANGRHRGPRVRPARLTPSHFCHAYRGKRRESGLGGGGAGGFGQKARRDSPPDLVLPFNALFARGADALGVEIGLRRLRALPPVEPRKQILARHLRMELQPPRGLPLDAERLHARRRARELHGAGGQRRHVVMPFEQLDRRCERTQDRIRRAGFRDLDVVPADLGLGHAIGRRPRGLGQQLASKADTEDRGAALELLAQEGLLRVQPSMLVVLIDMHRPPEDHECVEVVGRRRLARHPGGEVAEHA